MTPRLESGWLVIPCDEPDHAVIHLGVGKTEDEVGWRPAFRDWDAKGSRVAKIRPPTDEKLPVWIRINGEVKKLRSA